MNLSRCSSVRESRSVSESASISPCRWVGRLLFSLKVQVTLTRGSWCLEPHLQKKVVVLFFEFQLIVGKRGGKGSNTLNPSGSGCRAIQGWIRLWLEEDARKPGRIEVLFSPCPST